MLQNIWLLIIQIIELGYLNNTWALLYSSSLVEAISISTKSKHYQEFEVAIYQRQIAKCFECS